MKNTEKDWIMNHLEATDQIGQQELTFPDHLGATESRKGSCFQLYDRKN